MREPVEAGNDEDGGAEIEQNAGNYDMGSASEEPDSGREDNEYAKPGELAACSANGTGDGGKDEPCEYGTVRRGLQGAQTCIETEDDTKEGAHVGHEAFGKGQEERAEYQGEGSDGSVAGG